MKTSGIDMTSVRWTALLITSALVVGCGQDDLTETATGGTGQTEPATGQIVPTSNDSDLAASRSRRQVEDTETDQSNSLSRESIEIESYEGEPILLEEPAESLPATVVESQRTVSQEYEDGSVRIERQVTRYSDDRIVNDGTYREYFPNGQLFVEGEYEDGDQQGEWTYYHNNGQMNRTVTYQDGLLQGSGEVFRADGTREAQREFKNGIRHGTWITYDETGEQPLRKMNFKDGNSHGQFEEWFANGTKKGEYEFIEGQREGTAIEWDEDGNKRAQATYKNGKLDGQVIKWDMDGKKFVQQYDQGQLVNESNK